MFDIIFLFDIIVQDTFKYGGLHMPTKKNILCPTCYASSWFFITISVILGSMGASVVIIIFHKTDPMNPILGLMLSTVCWVMAYITFDEYRRSRIAAFLGHQEYFPSH